MLDGVVIEFWDVIGYEYWLMVMYAIGRENFQNVSLKV
jgi:hypothetical protein